MEESRSEDGNGRQIEQGERQASKGAVENAIITVGSLVHSRKYGHRERKEVDVSPSDLEEEELLDPREEGGQGFIDNGSGSLPNSR